MSPRIAALERDLRAGDAAPLGRFWREVVTNGSPLVEPVTGDDTHVLVTFLWRAAEPTRSVAVAECWLGSRERAATQLARLPGTDLWYKTYLAPSAARSTYRLAVDGDYDRLRLDPLNRAPFPPPPERPWRSSVTLPAAPPQPWAAPRAGVPAGHLRRERVASTTLGNERDLWIYTPPGDVHDGPPPGLLVILDGWDYLHRVGVPTTLDNLLAEHRISPLVAAFVTILDQPTRAHEYGGAGRRGFAAFLATELLPWLRLRYRATDDPARTVVCGVSLGGLAAVRAALLHPECFGNVLAQSAAVQRRPGEEPEDQWIVRQVERRPRLPIQFHLEAGTLEPALAAANRRLRDTLRVSGYPVHYAEFYGGHDYVCWRGTFADALQALTNQWVQRRQSTQNG